MSSPAPHTPDTTPRKMALNRSFTMPTKVTTTSRTTPNAEIGATEGVETLYIHPNAKIVKFTSAATSRPNSSTGASSPGGQGTLPWATLTEQTLAAGPLEIYRVPGSVSFLHSGTLLHAILPRSNCWCVDGVSKFAMRVLADTFYRIELPGASTEDLEKVEEFKEILKKVLFFERTACPFARTFTVDVPEEPQVRKKKKRYHGPAKKWKLEKAYSWKPEDGGEPPSRDSEPSSGSISASDDEGSSSAEEQSDSSEVPDQVSDLTVTTPSRPSVRERARGFNLRSVTAPPKLALQSTPPSKLRTSYAANETTKGGTTSSSSQENLPSALGPNALHPFQAIPTDMPPSPPDSSAELDFTEGPSQSTVSVSTLEAPRESDRLSPPRNDDFVDAPHADHFEESQALSDFTHEKSGQWGTRFSVAEEIDAAEPASSTMSNPPDPNVGKDLQRFVSEQHNQELWHETGYDLQHESVGESKTTSLPRSEAELDNEQSSELYAKYLGDDGLVTTAPGLQDPFAQIQARIQARRSIGGTTQFHLNSKSPTRQSSSSTESSGSSLASSRSSASRRQQSTHQQQQAFATALVRKACTTFLGPPTHLVMIMLRIAARFAKGAFPSALMFESPAGIPKRVPGSFDLDGSDVEDFGLDQLDGLDWEVDDFGVPLDSPVRLANVGTVSSAVREHLKERGTWSASGE